MGRGIAVSIALSKDKNKIYCILEWSKFNGITIESRYKLMEVKKLTDIDTQSNFLLECIDDKYLIYVEEDSYKRMSKVYCYYIETGEKKYIYKTNKKIIGVFVK